MKHIKTFVLLTICLGASTLLKAQQDRQQVKTEIAPETALKSPSPVDVNKIPAPQAKPTEEPAGMKIGKPVLLQQPADNKNGSLSPDQLKTANGTAQKPATVNTPGIKQQPENAKPVINIPPDQQ